MKMIKPILLSATVLAAGSAAATAESDSPKVDPTLPTYDRVSGISGNLSSIGSDTLNNLMTLWAEEFRSYYPNVNIQIQGAGSSTAPPAITEGTANFGPMSRQMKDGEVQTFEEKHGYPPTHIPVAIDALAVYVHRDNPIEGLSIQQVDAIFSATRRCGHDSDITRWGQLGLGGAWRNRDITIYGRNSVSGTYGYFRKNALCDGDFKQTVNEQPGSASVVQGVSETINGIGYSGIGYITSGVRAVPLAREHGSTPVAPTAEACISGEYPLARFLYIVVNKHPNRDLSPRDREFLKMVLSKQGQEAVVRDGYIPLPASVVEEWHKKLGLDK